MSILDWIYYVLHYIIYNSCYRNVDGLIIFIKNTGHITKFTGSSRAGGDDYCCAVFIHSVLLSGVGSKDVYHSAYHYYCTCESSREPSGC